MILLDDTDLRKIVVKVIEQGLEFHKLNLQVVISFIVVGDKIINGFDQRAEGFAIVFFFHKESVVGEYLYQIHETITPFFAKALGIRSQV